MAKWRDDVEAALRSIGGQGTLSQIYDAVMRVRQGNIPPSWQAIVRRELEYNSSDSESHQKRHDIFYSVKGIGSGVWGVRDAETMTPEADDIVSPPDRVASTVYRILRDTRMARRIKKLHGDKCQLCDTVIQLPDGVTYSEAHHLQPLGSPHFGPDVASNIVVLCPNHHALLDYGAMLIDKDALVGKELHKIESRYVSYHNSVIVSRK